MHEGVSELSEVGTVVELFCEYVQHIQLSINVENIYLVKVVVFPGVLFMDTGVIRSLLCEGFWPIHTGVVVIVEFGWKVEFGVW